MDKKDNITAAQRRKLFFIFGEIGFDDEARHNLVHEWTKGRTESLSGLDFIEAQQMIRNMDEILRKPQQRVYNALDIKRKGVIKAIFSYLENRGMDAEIDYVKSIAVRASGIAVTGIIAHDFNRIGEATLTRIYNEFCQKQHVQTVKNNLLTK